MIIDAMSVRVMDNYLPGMFDKMSSGKNANLSVCFTCDRVTAINIMKLHRICKGEGRLFWTAFNEQRVKDSVRYILPLGLTDDSEAFELWLSECKENERNYFDILKTSSLEIAKPTLLSSASICVCATSSFDEWYRRFEHMYQLKEDATKTLFYLVFERANVYAPKFFDKIYTKNYDAIQKALTNYAEYKEMVNKKIRRYC